MSDDHQYVNKNQDLDNDEENSINIDDNDIKNLLQDCKSGDELLIELVRSYPHIWDKKNKDFKDSFKKEASWKETADVMNLSVHDCKKRWERLRQYYSKERQKQDFETRSGSKRVERKEWKFYNAMSFLTNHMAKRNTFSNLSVNITDELNKDGHKKENDFDSELIDVDKISEFNTNRTIFEDVTNKLSSNSSSFSNVQQESCSSKMQDDSQTYFTRPTPSPSPKLLHSSTPSPRSLHSPSPSKSIASSLHKEEDKEMIQALFSATSSITKITDKITSQENETRDHALSNMILRELQAAKEPHKSNLRIKLMSILTEHMNSSYT